MASPVLVPYDPEWPARFEAEAARIRQALGPLAIRVDHHGSTAVPGLIAKPVIDIQVSVSSLTPLDPFVAALDAIGYRHLPHEDDAFAPFFFRPLSWPHTHHVHLVVAGGKQEARTLAFRDHLRAHLETARDYEALKLRLAERYGADNPEAREAYARAKGDFVEAIVARALRR